jgi:hypothetical protein
MGKDDDMDGGEVISIGSGTEEKEISVRRSPRKRSIPRDSTSRLRSLKCFTKVDELVRAGVFARTIAEHIQDESGEYMDVSFDAVVRAVRRYREQLENAGVRAAQEAAGDKPDEADPMFELYELQRNYREMRSRIDMEVATEKQLNKLFSTTHKEFMVAKDILSTILEEKRKLGIIGKDMDKNQRRGVVDGVAGRLDYNTAISNPESRQKVLAVVEMLFNDPELMDSLVKDKAVNPSSDDVKTPKVGSPKKVKSARRHKGRKAAVRADN